MTTGYCVIYRNLRSWTLYTVLLLIHISLSFSQCLDKTVAVSASTQANHL